MEGRRRLKSGEVSLKHKDLLKLDKENNKQKSSNMNCFLTLVSQ